MTTSKHILRLFVLIGFLVWAGATSAEQPLGLKQDRDNAPAQTLSTAEFAALSDPFFNVVLRRHADVTSLDGVEQLIVSGPVQRRVFVVDENIANPARGQSRRSVIAFTGTHPETGEVLNPNVMLSVFFDSEKFPDEPRSIEAWGWDNLRGRYNYYKMDETGTPQLSKTWKFRGASDDADLLNRFERRGTCMACHINGAPVMKELAFPWNNWRSFKFPTAYLSPTSPDIVRWPVTTSPRLQSLAGAEELETEFLLGAITQFNTRRINQALERRDDDGNVRVSADGRFSGSDWQATPPPALRNDRGQFDQQRGAVRFASPGPERTREAGGAGEDPELLLPQCGSYRRRWR